MSGSAALHLPSLVEGLNVVTLDVDDGTLSISAGDELSVPQPLHVELEVVRADLTFDVRGTVKGEGLTTCSRCGGESRVPIDLAIRLIGREVPPGGRDEVVESDDLVYHDGRTLDLSDALRQVVLVSVPMAPLCREGCLGLCPSCGIDRNVDRCTCDEKASDSRWHALGDLLERQRENDR